MNWQLSCQFAAVETLACHWGVYTYLTCPKKLGNLDGARCLRLIHVSVALGTLCINSAPDALAGSVEAKSGSIKVLLTAARQA